MGGRSLIVAEPYAAMLNDTGTTYKLAQHQWGRNAGTPVAPATEPSKSDKILPDHCPLAPVANPVLGPVLGPVIGPLLGT